MKRIITLGSNSSAWSWSISEYSAINLQSVYTVGVVINAEYRDPASPELVLNILCDKVTIICTGRDDSKKGGIKIAVALK